MREEWEYVERREVKEMIEEAIKQHNRNASIISAIVGSIILGLYADGLLRLMGAIKPLAPWLDISIM